MKDNNEIFLEFWQNYKWPDTPQLYFRLYHDEQGNPICYSREHRPGNFVDVTPEQFAIANMNVTVQNGMIVAVTPPPPPKMRPGDHGRACHSQDVTIIVESGSINTRYWSKD